MVEVFIIAIVMWWSDATQTPLENAIEVTHLHGLPLYFKTEEECGKIHSIWNDLQPTCTWKS